MLRCGIPIVTLFNATLNAIVESEGRGTEDRVEGAVYQLEKSLAEPCVIIIVW